MTLAEEYIKYYNEYKEKYNKVVVLLQKGKFYEMYNFNGQAKEIADLLNFRLTKPIASRDKYEMCGIPIGETQERHFDIILNNGYTIIFIDQFEKQGRVERKVGRIISPSTNLNSEVGTVLIYIEELRNKLYCGLSYIDVLTGECYCKEIGNDNFIESVYEFIDSHNPKEVIIKSKNLNKYSKEQLISLLDLSIKNYTYFIKLNEVEKVYYNVVYQEEVFKKVYTNHDILQSIHEHLDIHDKALASISFCILLQYIYEQSPEILKKLHKVQVNEDSQKLILDYNSISQLNLISGNTIGINSVFDILNQTSTVGGKNLLNERLRQPLKNKEEIETRLNIISGIIEKDNIKELEQELKSVTHIIKQIKKMMIHQISEQEFYDLHKNLEILLRLYKFKCLPDELDTSKIKSIVKEYNKKFVNGQINEESFSDILKLRNEYTEHFTKLEEIRNKLSECIEPGKDNVKIIIERDSISLITTPIKTKKIKEQYSEYTFKSLKSISRISSKEVDELTDKLMLLQIKIDKKKRKAFKEIIIEYEQHYDILEQSANYLNNLDYFKSCSKVAIKYNYCKPEIHSNKSFIEAQNVRHPLVERICKDEYITNDCTMKENGILLYGLNCSGKTTYSKAIGINIILAQCGMYVASETFKLGLFDKIMTRITGSDNILKGQSTFAVEMQELNSIFKKATNKTLVIGDEICRGTDSESGGGIVAATLEYLTESKIPFIFSSHLHNIMKLEEIKKIKNLQVLHLKVETINGKLVYNRRIQTGQGSTMYGIEVAESMGLPKDIITKSIKYRRKLTKESEFILKPKVSKYNKNKFVDNCEICGEQAEDIHHKSFQCNADSNGFITESGRKHIHKNNLVNLLAVCKRCHINIHHGK